MITEALKQQAKEKRVEVHYALVKSNGQDMHAISYLLEKGIVKSHIYKVFPFSEMANAHLEMEKGRTVGKIIVKI